MSLLAGHGRCRNLLQAAREGAVSPPVDMRFLSRPYCNQQIEKDVRGDIVSYLSSLYESVAEVMPDSNVRDSTLEDDSAVEIDVEQGVEQSQSDPYTVEFNKQASKKPVTSKAKGKPKVRKMRRGVKMNPDRVPGETQVSGKEVRKLPPGAIKEYWEQYKLNSALSSPAGFPYFWKAPLLVWCKPFLVLKRLNFETIRSTDSNLNSHWDLRCGYPSSHSYNFVRRENMHSATRA